MKEKDWKFHHTFKEKFTWKIMYVCAANNKKIAP